ncbi:helix-turn-helix transcriptional regulator [Desnuesiella massiliensis]|uniref:helix-turn-helix transcriptional regulator n=1 Tax=Desnuesiella massiliensis TaxID=1650662 RepID=UPI0006E28DA4|nr:helix-turn-helix transcriptional regulator [Desnuesiella massiliensis]
MNYKERIQASIEYIESNLEEKILLENLAKQVFLSKYHYHRVFHELVGETVMTYIRKRRLTEAAKELIDSNIKIVDVALKYQFGSQEAFSRAFRRMFKISPGEFRKIKINILQYKKIHLCHENTTTPVMMNSFCKVA